MILYFFPTELFPDLLILQTFELHRGRRVIESNKFASNLMILMQILSMFTDKSAGLKMLLCPRSLCCLLWTWIEWPS